MMSYVAQKESPTLTPWAITDNKLDQLDLYATLGVE